MQVANFQEDNPSPRRLIDRIRDIIKAINGGIEFGQPAGAGQTNPPAGVNIGGAWGAGVSPGANVEFTFNHNLNRIPTGWAVLSVDKASILYRGATAWTNKQVFLKFDQATVTYNIFIT